MEGGNEGVRLEANHRGDGVADKPQEPRAQCRSYGAGWSSMWQCPSCAALAGGGVSKDLRNRENREYGDGPLSGPTESSSSLAALRISSTSANGFWRRGREGRGSNQRDDRYRPAGNQETHLFENRLHKVPDDRGVLDSVGVHRAAALGDWENGQQCRRGERHRQSSGRVRRNQKTTWRAGWSKAGVGAGAISCSADGRLRGEQWPLTGFTD